MLSRRSLLLLLPLVPFFRLRAEPVGMPELEDLFPTDNILADVMVLRFPPRMNELYARMNAATAANSAWFDAFVAAHPDVKSRPYDPRLGLSEPEYREYLILRYGTKPEKVRELELKVKRTSGAVEIRFDQNSNAIQPIRVDFKNKTLSTPLVAVGHPEVRETKDPDGLLGPNQSYNWHGQSSSADGETLTTVSFTVGRFTGNGRKFIQYRVSRTVSGEQDINFIKNLYYN